MSRKTVHVAVGVIVNHDGKILIAKRPQTVHQGGLWEFPGGKVEPGESVYQALVRELYEELAVTVEKIEPLIKIQHDYGDKSVLLDVYKVTHFSGDACGNEGQPIAWVAVEDLKQYPFPSANRAIITALTLSDAMLVTAEGVSAAELLLNAERALQNKIRLIQLRCPNLPNSEFLVLAKQIKALCLSYSAHLLLNTSVDIFSQVLATGLHLNSHQLKHFVSRPVSTNYLLGASCHNAEEIVQARLLGVDYITLSPVAKTASHPNAAALGWDAFSALAAQAGVPVFALGGMELTDLATAKAAGAQGIAGIRCWLNQ